MKAFQFVSRAGLVAVVIAGVAACAPTDDLRQWVAQEKAKKGAPLTPLPVIKTFETFVYNDKDRRNPFELSAEEQEQAAISGPQPDPNRPREPLEAFPLDGLKMSGTLGLAKSMEGLIRDPDGVVHRVRVGNYLGQNYGRISAIAEDRIDLVELIPNGGGGWMERAATIALGDGKQ
ncbi:pilus assembly protein PilP [Dokdonella sp.]|uniref:pilus assembly protein PilP n=1 Tax=Dokdonella sp. TaxID=2291710 RepID=UPI001B112599|nr:pilus assembly protein PilP [Dokdonella sp.]MBO9664283.1 pilus assembly protein PilP [Dokdonella sp.]